MLTRLTWKMFPHRTSDGYRVSNYAEHLRRSKRLASALSHWGVQLQESGTFLCFFLLFFFRGGIFFFQWGWALTYIIYIYYLYMFICLKVYIESMYNQYKCFFPNCSRYSIYFYKTHIPVIKKTTPDHYILLMG